MTAPISPINMDTHAEAIDGTPDVWAHEPVSAKVFRRDRIAQSHPVMMRHRRRPTFKGFVLHPAVSVGLALVSIAGIVAILYARGVLS